MANIKLIAVGSIKEAYYRNKINEYMGQIQRHGDLKLVEIKDESIPRNAGDRICERIKLVEGEKILSHIQPQDYVIALCIDGTPTTEEKLINVLQRAETGAKTGCITFVIGGSLGLSEQVIRRADYRMSCSNMTFPHQLMRVMLLGQLATYDR